MNVGFCGLGRMGRPMARNLLRAGTPLAVSSRRGDVQDEFRALGAHVVGDTRELARADIVFLCLPNGDVVEDLLLGERGLVSAMGSGKIIVDLSTISYRTTLRLAERCAAHDVGFVDAPVSGMEPRAIEGTLTVMCGGERETVERVRPLLRCVGTTIVHMGASGSGQLAKLVNQLLFDINAAALAEILPMAVKLGLDPRKTADVVNSGTGKSYASEYFIPRILEGSFTNGYPMNLAYKDLVSGFEIGVGMCLPMPVLSAATHTYQTALLRGLGDLDKGAMIRVFEDLLDVQFRAATVDAAVSAA